MTPTQKYSKRFYYVVCLKNKSVLAVLRTSGMFTTQWFRTRHYRIWHASTQASS
jgi:hypothetical protein